MEKTMSLMSKPVTMKLWQTYVLLALSGFAAGNIAAKTMAALGL